jgi:hypothetical protein
MDEAQRKKLEAGKKRLEEFRKKKEAQEAASANKSSTPITTDIDNAHSSVDNKSIDLSTPGK